MSARMLLLDLVTAAALLWMTLSDSWVSIGLTAALVVVRLASPVRQPV